MAAWVRSAAAIVYEKGQQDGRRSSPVGRSPTRAAERSVTERAAVVRLGHASVERGRHPEDYFAGLVAQPDDLTSAPDCRRYNINILLPAALSHGCPK
jgi:hypothetical protein